MAPRLKRREPRREHPSGGPAERRRTGARSLRTGARSWGGPLVAGLAEVVAIGREMLAIPARLALRLAERLGLLVLAAWRLARPVLGAGLALGRRGLLAAERELTPARALAGVTLAMAALLAVTQFLDYRDVQAGVPAYAGVENLAPAPVVTGSAETAGSAHAYLLLLVAIAAAGVVALSATGRWRLARSLLFLGLVAVAVAIFVDAPHGLEEGQAAIEFSGAEARLLGPFWVELFAGVAIAVCGPLLAASLRPARRGGRARAPSPRARRSRLGRSDVQGARS